MKRAAAHSFLHVNHLSLICEGVRVATVFCFRFFLLREAGAQGGSSLVLFVILAFSTPEVLTISKDTQNISDLNYNYTPRQFFFHPLPLSPSPFPVVLPVYSSTLDPDVKNGQLVTDKSRSRNNGRNTQKTFTAEGQI